MKALLVGYGKMGKAIEAALIRRGHAVAGRYDRGETEDFLEGNGAGGDVAAGIAAAAHLAEPAASSPSKKTLPSSSDIAFEFTTPSSAPRVVPFLLSKKIPVLSGTTGWDVAPAERLARELGVPFLHSSNFSLGVAALRRAADAAASALAAFPEFEAGIVERHHSAKKDAPSGTAKTLAADVALASGRTPPIVSLRHGGAPGEHVLVFEGPEETVELVHRARSRAIFAQGAVRAAEWLLASGRRGPVAFDDFFDDLSGRGGAS